MVRISARGAFKRWRPEGLCPLLHARIGLLFGCCALAATLQGCSVGKTYREIDPQAAEQETRQHNGYFALKQVPAGAAKLVLRSEGKFKPAQFAVSLSDADCEGFAAAGRTMDGARDELLPWVAKMTAAVSRPGARGFIARDIEAGRSIQVGASGSMSSMDGVGRERTVTGTSCTPQPLRFTPVAGRAYLVRFIWESEPCTLVIDDATDPDRPVRLSGELVRLLSCRKEP